VLGSAVSSQLESASIQTAVRKHKDKTNKTQRRIDQIRLLTLYMRFKELFIDLQTALAVKTHLAEAATNVYSTV
jgi:hypothetical protein